MTEKVTATISAVSAWIAIVTLKDFQVLTTIVAGLIAIVSGLISLLINLKKLKK